MSTRASCINITKKQAKEKKTKRVRVFVFI
jgi:hypothetical protein